MFLLSHDILTMVYKGFDEVTAEALENGLAIASSLY